MQAFRKEHRAGVDFLAAATALLHRSRSAHPIKGLYEAADLQWWWSVPRRTDPLDQLFWFDDDGRAEAAALMIDFGSGSLGSSRLFDEVTFCPFFMPDPDPELVAHVVERGLARAAKHGFTSVEHEVDQADVVIMR